MKRVNRIYLDSAAATGRGNPSSIHGAGIRSRLALDKARQEVADFLAARVDEIIFTASGTESNNLALLGLFANQPFAKQHFITTAIEHSSILETCRELERRGAVVTYLPVDGEGLIDPQSLAKVLRPETKLVSIGYANNEIGVIQPLRDIAKVIRRYRSQLGQAAPFFHTDACQAARFLDLNVLRLGVDFLTLNASKIYGPEGVAALYARRGIPLRPIIFGGGQERGYRSGTENVTGARGLAAALRVCVKKRISESARLVKLRDYFIKKITALIPDTYLNGSLDNRLPNNINLSFLGAESEYLVLALDAAGVAVSSGSACGAHLRSDSYVIEALGRSADYARGAARFTLGRETTKTQLNYVLKILPSIIARARKSVLQ